MAGEVAPHLAFPLRLRAGQWQTVEQDSRRHHEDQAEVLLRTRPGALEADPDLGLRNLVGTVGPVAPAIVDALQEFVPTARFDVTEGLPERVRDVAVKIAAEES